MLRWVTGVVVVASVVAAAAAGESPPQPVTPLGFTSIHSFGAAWSPDGRRLALARSDGHHWPPRIVVMNADRSGARTIGAGFAPSWSPDGRRVAFVEIGPGQDQPRYLTVAAADGSGSHRLFRIEAGLEDRPAWSPDGVLIAFRTGLDISVVRPDGRRLRLLIRGAAEPDWSPDGKRLVFVTIGNGDAGHVEVADADGSGRHRLQGVEPVGGLEPRWSPDGRRIAVVSGNDSTGPVVYVMDADGSDAVPVTPHGFQQPSWGADSVHLAVSSQDDEVYVVGLDGSTPVRLTFGGCTIVGTDGPDRLLGKAGDDVICGFGGADVIDGGAGDDRIVGGSGDDRILGGPGRDTIFGEDGADVIDGGPGRDTIHGGAGADVIRSRDSDPDFVEGGAGLDNATADAKDCLILVERGRGGVRDCTGTPTFAVAGDPVWSPDGTRIAFVDRRGTIGTLYVMNADGGGIRRVIDGWFDAGAPSFSPDGRRIVFQHVNVFGSGRPPGIYVVGGDGVGLRRIAGGYEPAWGPGGKAIAFTAGGDQSPIMAVSPTGTGLRLIARPPPESGGEGSCEANTYMEPTWSPDGEYVAFAVTGAGGECGFSVFIGATRGFGARVKVLAGCWCEEPDWSPDGKRIAIVTYPPAGGEPYYTVAVADLHTRAIRKLRPGWSPRWSPDGKRILFVAGNAFGPRPRSQIYVMDADGSHARRLTPTRA